ncbi:MAG TPA: alpha/beta hydrolase [Burkholderiales bacterium]
MEWLVAVVALVLAVPVVMYVGQDRLLFHPQPVPENARTQIEHSFPGAASVFVLGSDAMEWFDYAKQKLEAPQVVVFGRSLGSGVAVQLAAARAVEGVILSTPYDSMTNVASHHYPYLPVSWMLKHPFDSVARAPSIAAPLLCLVAEHDQVIRVVHSKRLLEAWKGPKRWVELAGAGHNSTDDVPAFWQAIREFLVQPH